MVDFGLVQGQEKRFITKSIDFKNFKEIFTLISKNKKIDCLPVKKQPEICLLSNPCFWWSGALESRMGIGKKVSEWTNFTPKGQWPEAVCDTASG